MLGFVPKPSWSGQPHYDRRNKATLDRSWPVNDAYFAEARFEHNSAGLRGRELTEEDLRRDFIFVFGGSSTYDWNVTQGSTWVEGLESDLHQKFTVVNFGVPNHTTAQHLVYTEFYERILGKLPRCAIYYAGWNDLLNLHVPDLDPSYANAQSGRIVLRKSELWMAKYSPLTRLANLVAQRRFDSVPIVPAPNVSGPIGKAPQLDSVDRLIEMFVDNVRAIATINDQRGIKTVFIGQLANRELLNRRPEFRFFSPYMTSKDIWPMQARFNAMMRVTAIQAGARYIDVDVNSFSNGDFADMVHFSAQGSKKFAQSISERVEEYCQ